MKNLYQGTRAQIKTDKTGDSFSIECGVRQGDPLTKFIQLHFRRVIVLRGGGHLAIKINITFFVGIHVLNIFYLTTFSKKTIFSKI